VIFLDHNQGANNPAFEFQKFGFNVYLIKPFAAESAAREPSDVVSKMLVGSLVTGSGWKI
jgi:hypothetical protein